MEDKIFDYINSENERQHKFVNLIPSENIVSKAVMNALGSVLINKYSEGQVGKRYYQGNENIDLIESEVKKRALNLFGLTNSDWKVFVQAPTGSIANLGLISAVCNIGDSILSMHLFDGGHLSHGWKLSEDRKVTLSSKIYSTNFYHVRQTDGIIDYEMLEQKCKEIRPKLIITGGTAYPRDIDYEKVAEIAHRYGALYLADVAHEAGLIATGFLNNPFLAADFVTMTTRKTLRGPIGSLVFYKSSYEEAVEKAFFPGILGGPQNNSIAAIGVALGEAGTKDFVNYSAQVLKNAKVFEEVFIDEGLNLVSGGTDKHFLLIDLRNIGIDGSFASDVLYKNGIIVNKNTVPYDTGKPWKPSGIRLGTPFITTQGYLEDDVRKVARQISYILKNQRW